MRSNGVRDRLKFGQLADPDSEFRLLGICLDRAELAHQLFAHARSEWFTDPDTSALFDAMRKVYRQTNSVDQTRVFRWLKQHRNDAGALLRRTLEYNILPSEFEPSMASVEEMHRRRSMLAAAKAIEEIAYRMDETIDVLEGEALDAIISAFRENETAQIRSIGDVSADLAVDLRERYDNGTIPAIPTGLRALDYVVKGLRPKDLIVVGGRTGMGKTHTVLHLAKTAAKRGKRVWIVSLEMSATDLAERLLAGEVGIDGEAAWRMDKATYDRMCSALAPMSEWPLWITDKRGMTADQIGSLARIVKAQHGLDLVVVDYLQLIRSPGFAKDEHLRIGNIVHSLRDLAGDLDVPVVLVSQLNRDTERRVGARPTMVDLRASGTIEEHADVILLLYRLDYYHHEATLRPETQAISGVLEIIVAKQRKGETGSTVFVKLERERSVMSDLTEHERAEYIAAARRLAS